MKELQKTRVMLYAKRIPKHCCLCFISDVPEGPHSQRNFMEGKIMKKYFNKKRKEKRDLHINLCRYFNNQSWDAGRLCYYGAACGKRKYRKQQDTECIRPAGGENSSNRTDAG